MIRIWLSKLLNITWEQVYSQLFVAFSFVKPPIRRKVPLPWRFAGDSFVLNDDLIQEPSSAKAFTVVANTNFAKGALLAQLKVHQLVEHDQGILKLDL